ncbi:hypothetical protein NKOR_06250 [Candidatus Nitrosopumilus koreensis AR1]|uniref:Uncharacterized protein n=1 Tax=Candidatus Nitrosopumilus koreensis AR1 TaxID=1229908 RepID=K0B9J2_9ARCH|nr:MULTISPECIES: hypothetical protein [Nitrosopumilus]AFS81131.1 hypothetical protein NKOR_06250 [Candidatus Nitrosopumilus koreensis AR1]
MSLKKEDLESKLKESGISSDDLTQILNYYDDAEKYRNLKEKMNEIEADSYLLDRLEACDTSGAAEILRNFLSSKE